MSIKSLKTIKPLGINTENTEISFSNSNLVSLIGKSGSGKSSFLKELNEKINKGHYSDLIEDIVINQEILKTDLISLLEKNHFFDDDLIK